MLELGGWRVFRGFLGTGRLERAWGSLGKRYGGFGVLNCMEEFGGFVGVGSLEKLEGFYWYLGFPTAWKDLGVSFQLGGWKGVSGFSWREVLGGFGCFFGIRKLESVEAFCLD